ncbi:hypothetical protein [Enterococcus sp.]|uniref:hypothetical protein n=1 Tax=Enterococcus sp. TaxID=35783 RepID=UPI0039929627
MVKATIRASIDQDIQKKWQIVTNLQDYSWRSDLSKIEVKAVYRIHKKRVSHNIYDYRQRAFHVVFIYDGKHKYARALARKIHQIRCSDRYDLYGRGNAEEVLFETIC